MVDISDAQKIVKAAGSALFGKNDRIELAVAAFLSGGHLLIEDVPGVGKTTLAKAIALSVKGSFSRIQFTSDMLPLDITGFSVINKDSGELAFQKGPLFADFVLADEINRASPKTQSALLEAMSEKQITIDSSTYRLPRHFMVIATQNTHDSYGTYQLPESQLDRFSMRIDLGYAEPEIEKNIITNTRSGFDNTDIPHVLFSNDEIRELKDIVDAVHIDESVLNYIMAIIQKTRESKFISLGAGPRGGIAMVKCVRAMAVIKGRKFVTADDVKSLALPVLAHRITLKGSSSTELSKRLIKDIVDSIEVPL